MEKRNLAEVIDKMLAEIPESETDLRAGMANIRSSVTFCAPEQMGLWWHETVDLLMAKVGEPKKDWQRKVADIFAGKTG